MKQILNFLGIITAGALGYLYEPKLRPKLTGPDTPAAAVAATPSKDTPNAKTTPSAPSLDLTALTPDQLPERILLKAAVKVADSASGLVMTIDAGNRVKLIRVSGDEAVISPGEGPFLGRLPVSDTDLREQLTTNPPPPAASNPNPATAPSTDPATAVTETPAAPETTPEPAPETEPEIAPTPTPEPAPAAAEISTDPVKIMQNSVRIAQIKEFTFEQVLTWEAGPEESIDGATFQTGLASYKAETIFGLKTIQAKALIKDGKVQRWIWPKSGMEIK